MLLSSNETKGTATAVPFYYLSPKSHSDWNGFYFVVCSCANVCTKMDLDMAQSKNAANWWRCAQNTLVG
jgi:hypothetical protein